MDRKKARDYLLPGLWATCQHYPETGAWDLSVKDDGLHIENYSGDNLSRSKLIMSNDEIEREEFKSKYVPRMFSIVKEGNWS